MDQGQRSTRKSKTCKTSGRATLSLIPLCLFMLLGSPAGGQSEAADRLAPQDTVEIRVSGWSALRGGVAEASLLTDAFTIGTAGLFELPIIGHVPATGLRADELAKLITDRLRARSGLLERPVTTVQLKQFPSLAVRGAVERPGKYPYRSNLTVQEAIEAAGELAPFEETETQLTLSISRSVGRVRELTVAWNTLVLPGDIISVRRTPAPETRSARISTGSSSADALDRTNTEERQLETQPSPSGSRAEQQQALERERSKADALLRDLSAARRETEAVREEAESVRKEALAARLAAREAVEAWAEARRVLDEERQKVERFERDLTAARRSIDALEASENRAAAAQAAALQDRQVAEAAAKRVGEQLALERGRADLVAQDLDGARKVRDAAKEELTRVSAELLAALEQERDKAIGLARDLIAARKDFDMLKAQDERRTARIERTPPKARATANPRVSMRASARLAHQSGSQEIRKVEVRKPSQPVRVTTIVLPDALLPKRFRSEN
jgi:protein involved in polysaccharide export with SLBB domain